MLVTGSVLLARVVVWILAVASTIVGICLLASGTVEKHMIDEVQIVDVTGVGTALLAVGLLILAALLIAEGYVPSAHRASDSESTPDA